jgi:hypothetical protein
MGKLAQTVGDGAFWSPVDSQTAYVTELLEKHFPSLAGTDNFESLASTDWEALNAFLVSHKFAPKIEYFDPSQGIGVVSVMDLLLKWAQGPAKKATIDTEVGEKPGFHIPEGGVEAYTVRGYAGILLKIAVRGKQTLWLYVPGESEPYLADTDGLLLVALTIAISSARHYRRYESDHEGVVLPMVDFSLEPDISFLLGAELVSDSDSLFVNQAGQQFKFRMNEEGARVKTETHIVAMRGIMAEPQPFIVDRPFFGWVSMNGIDLPVAAFYADFDSWKQPEGSLQDL